MKTLLSAAAAVALLASAAAFAQSTTATPDPATAPVAAPAAFTPPPSQCAAAPAAPTLPDGTKAKSAVMEKGNQEFLAWAAGADSSINCLRAEFAESEKVMKARLEAANAAIRSSNEVRNNWIQQVQAYCKRIGNPKGCATEAPPAP
jgi:hypothetical protein